MRRIFNIDGDKSHGGGPNFIFLRKATSLARPHQVRLCRKKPEVTRRPLQKPSVTQSLTRPPKSEKSRKNAKNCEKSRKSRFPGVSRGLPYTPSRTQILAIFRKNPGFRPDPPTNSQKWNFEPQKGLQITAFLARFLVISAPAQTLTRPYSHEADDNESGFFFSWTLSEKCKFR